MISRPHILALDTSSDLVTLSVSYGPEVIFESSTGANRNHSKIVLSLIDQALKTVGKNLQDMDVFSVICGPGSFTGLRIGLGTIKGFCYALSKPLICLPTLPALAFPLRDHGSVISISEARPQFVYAAQIEFSGEEWKYNADPVMIPVATLKEITSQKWIVGAGARKYKDFCANDTKLADSSFDNVCGKSLAHMSNHEFLKGNFTNVETAEPLYIQKTAAEGYV